MRYRFIVIVLVVAFAASVAHALDPSKDESVPDSHRAGWLARHQSTAKADSASCTGCHKPYFCINCHNRRDSIQQVVHRRNFKFYHSVEARTNPRKCDECHQIQFCTDCHSNPQ